MAKSKRSKENIEVYFCGENSHDVTNSMTLVKYNDTQILLDCGLYQSSNMRKSYETNSREFDFKPKNVAFAMVSHLHIDHVGLLPRLYREGFRGEIFIPKYSKGIMEIMLRDSLKILTNDREYLSKIHGKNFPVVYEESDINGMMDLVCELDFNKKFKVSDTLELEFYHAGHILFSSQIMLYINHQNKINKILYTGDLGNENIKKHYTEDMQKIKQADLVIAESTYSARSKVSANIKQRDKDIEKIKVAVQEICYDKKGRLFLPTFSLDRFPNLITQLYYIFKDDENFNIPIYLDSPLALKLLNEYKLLVSERDKIILEEVLNWDNIHYIKEHSVSESLAMCKKPKIIISSSGMINSGKSKFWSKHIIPSSSDMILITGYSAEGTIANKLRNEHKNKTILIDGKQYKNKCAVGTLNSFSSHITYENMIEYYTDINCNTICLVHSNKNTKNEFAQVLKLAYEDKNKTTKVISTIKDTKIYL